MKPQMLCEICTRTIQQTLEIHKHYLEFLLTSKKFMQFNSYCYYYFQCEQI